MSGVRQSVPPSSPISAPTKKVGVRVQPNPAAVAAQPQSGEAWSRQYRKILIVNDSGIITGVVLLAGLALAPGGAASMPATTPGLFATALLVFAVWIVMMWLFRTRDARLIGVGPEEYKQVVRCCAATIGWLAVAVLIAGSGPTQLFIFLAVPAGGLLLVVSRWLWRRWLIRQRAFGHYLSRVVVLGRKVDVRYVIRQIGKNSGAAYEVVGAVLEEDPSAQSISVDHCQVPIVADIDSVSEAVGAVRADAVIVAGHLSHGSGFVRELGWKLESTSTELVLASSLTNVAGPRIRMRPVEGLPLMHVELPYFSGGRHIAKRAVDIVVSALALVCLSPLLLALGLMIRHDSPGRALFCQQRVGRRGDNFRMYKFRSMVQTAEDELADLVKRNEGAGPLFKLRSDPRVTRVGAWIRKFSLDELPQFYNVFKGDMSLVGPRPPLPTEVADYQGHVHRRLFIKPGITGLWQINGRSDLDWEESVRLDLYYVENWSLTGDLMIMWRTLKVMLKPEGAY